MLRTHCQTSGVSLTEQDPYNNIVRTTIEAMAAVLGGTQSLHTNSFDEAIALPTEFAARIARNTQLILAEETGITHVVDPLGGSYYVESLTHELATEAWKLIEEVEALGGMTKAIEAGMPKLRIEEAAARRQARVDRGEDVIVGVNKYRLDRRARRSTSATSTTPPCASSRSHGSSTFRATRDDAAVHASARGAHATAQRGDGNLLELAVDAARARATVGEISDALEEVFARHRAEVRTISGVYGARVRGRRGVRRASGRGRGVRRSARAGGRACSS